MKRTLMIGVATAALAVGPAALASAGEQHNGGQPSQSCGCEPRHHGHGHEGHGKPGHHGNGEHPKPHPTPKPHPRPKPPGHHHGPNCGHQPPKPRPPHHGGHHHHPRPPKPPVVHPRPPVVTPPAHHATPVVHKHTSHVAGHPAAPSKQLAFTASEFRLDRYVEGGVALLTFGAGLGWVFRKKVQP